MDVRKCRLNFQIFVGKIL